MKDIMCHNSNRTFSNGNFLLLDVRLTFEENDSFMENVHRYVF